MKLYMVKNKRFLRFLYYPIISRLIPQGDDESVKAKFERDCNTAILGGLRVSVVQSDINESSSVENVKTLFDIPKVGWSYYSGGRLG